MKLFYKFKKTFLTKSFIIFIIIGLINTIIYNEYYIIFNYYINYLLGSVLAYILSMTCSYLMNTIYNFNIKPCLKNYLLFPLSGIPTLFCQTIGLSIFVEYLNIPENYAGFIASLIAIPFSFIIMKIIFKKK